MSLERDISRKPFKLEESQITQPDVQKLGYKQSAQRLYFDVLIGSLVSLAEVKRADLVHPGAFNFEGEGKLNPDNPAYDILQNAGDFYDGYKLAFVAYTAFGLVDVFQSLISKKRVPVRYKQTTSVLFGIGIVAMTEAGITGLTQTADLQDIPAGVAGALLYLGVNNLTRKIVQKKEGLRKVRTEKPSKRLQEPTRSKTRRRNKGRKKL